MAKIKLNPDPTFSAKVAIPVHGSAPVDVCFTFKHRTKDDLAAWLETIKDKADVDVAMECVTAWEFDDAFNAANIGKLFQNYIGSPGAIIQAYMDELLAARIKN